LRARTESAGMLATSANGAGAADDAAAVRDDQGAVGEPGFVAGERAAPELDPELVEWAERRSFTAKCQLEILAKLEAGTRLGEVGELLRREGLYTSHLTYLRKQVRDGALKELGKPRGGKPADRGAPQCAKLVGERVPARTTAFVFDRPDHPRPHRRPSASWPGANLTADSAPASWWASRRR
jgi:hypothetical protein